MHICIVGTGAAGWIACNYLKHFDFIKKITIVGSSKIPNIGVGESTTFTMQEFINNIMQKDGFSKNDFIKNTDAVIKYGVMYEGWSKKDFIHYFKQDSEFSQFDEPYSKFFYGRLLANKNENTFIHDLMGRQIFQESKKNNLMLNQNMYGNAFHFDAALFIDFMSKNALKHYKVSLIDDIVISVNKTNDIVDSIKINNSEFFADYYIFATGDNNINEKFLNIEYTDLSKILLTNKAVVYPLKYRDKRKQFHPYTVARTMKYGWRWITPTWSRIGTGYVFSDNYISKDDAIKEFRENIGDDSIEPIVVNFAPKTNKKQIRDNWCTIGMASGFLEPLDAPGLHLTISSLMHQIIHYLEYKLFAKNFENEDKKIAELEKLNATINLKTDFFITFILAQYKTSIRDDTDFWKDHKNVFWKTYEKHMDNLDEINPSLEKMMLQQTISAKDIRWPTSLNAPPYKTNITNFETIHHLDYISELRNQ